MIVSSVLSVPQDKMQLQNFQMPPVLWTTTVTVAIQH